MPKLIGTSQTVVKHDGLTIDELAGNVATCDDTISIAYVHVAKPTAEPWLTLDYDEWICVKEGSLELHYYQVESDTKTDTDTKTSEKQVQILTVNAGETAFIAKGERFRPIFPTGNVSYIPVCLPAFRPDRCIREEEEEASDVTKKLRELHGMVVDDNNDNTNASPSPPSNVPSNDILYHMCQKELWDQAVESGNAYFPPTFEQDGNFTHATAVPARLITTANHFYTGTEGDWICLQLSRSALKKLGIVTIDEGALPVGETATSDEWEKSAWICPHIYGGLPTSKSLGVLTTTYKMIRDNDGNFLSIEHLT